MLLSTIHCSNKVLKCLQDYPLLLCYIDNSGNFIDIPYSEYENNKEIMKSIKDLMLNTSFFLNGHTKIWYMNIIMLSNEDNEGIPYVRLSLGNSNLS